MKFIDKSLPWNDTVLPAFAIEDNAALRIRFVSENGLILVIGKIPLPRITVSLIIDYINHSRYDATWLAQIEEELGITPDNDNFLTPNPNELFITLYSSESPMFFDIELFKCYPATPDAVLKPEFRSGISSLICLFDRRTTANPLKTGRAD